MRKTYRLCYRRVGNGPFQATFTEAGVEGRRIINRSGRLNLVSTDGRSHAEMRGYLHFDEFSDSAAPLWWGSSIFAVDEITDLQCTIEPDGMHAAGVCLRPARWSAMVSRLVARDVSPRRQPRRRAVMIGRPTPSAGAHAAEPRSRWEGVSAILIGSGLP